MPERIRCGCVLFDDPDRHGAGWASTEGGKPYRIRGTRDLSSGTVWLTNLDYDRMFTAGLSDHSRFRRRDFLRTDIGRITDQMGLGPVMTGGDRVRDDLAPEQAQALSGVFTGVMLLAERRIGISNVLTMRTLASGIREVIGPPDPMLPESVADALEGAVEYYTRCERGGPVMDDEGPVAPFIAPRIRHARSILGEIYPAGGDWSPVARLPETGDSLTDWMGTMNGPFVARITVEAVDPTLNHLVNFGNGLAGAVSRPHKRWVTPYDLITLSTSRIVVHEAIQSPGGHRLSRISAVLEGLGDAHEGSISAGLFAENLWVGIGASYRPQAGYRRKGSRPVNPYTPFVRALDRMLILKAALALRGAGMDVLGYGAGGIMVRVGHETPEEILDAAHRSGLIPPACGVFASLGDRPLDAVRGVWASGRTDMMTHLNCAVLEEVLG